MLTLEYNDDLGTAVDKVNRELAPRGLQFVFDEVEREGVVAYELTETDLPCAGGAIQ